MYTKGPWKLNEGMCAVQAKGPSGFWDVVAKCYDGTCYTKENLANARLIAAAPCLLSLAEKYLVLLESDFVGRNGRDLSGGRIEEARAIINKVKGE